MYSAPEYGVCRARSIPESLHLPNILRSQRARWSVVGVDDRAQPAMYRYQDQVAIPIADILSCDRSSSVFRPYQRAACPLPGQIRHADNPLDAMCYFFHAQQRTASKDVAKVITRSSHRIATAATLGLWVERLRCPGRGYHEREPMSD
jgi:hypothetical protein